MKKQVEMAEKKKRSQDNPKVRENLLKRIEEKSFLEKENWYSSFLDRNDHWHLENIEKILIITLIQKN